MISALNLTETGAAMAKAASLRAAGLLLALVSALPLAAHTKDGEGRPVVNTGYLVEFVGRSSSDYRWEIEGDVEQQDGVSVYRLAMVSQRWSPAGLEVKPELWQHRMSVAIPEHYQGEKPAILHVTGGTRHSLPSSDKGGLTTKDRLDVVRIARETGTLVAEVQDIPNQHLIMDGIPCKEDWSIAKSWAAYLNNPSCFDCPLQLPMTRAVSKAMDTVQALAQEKMNGKAPETFIVAGGSKRGWVTWLAAAVDSRVVAIVPMVIDVLNVQKNMAHIKQVHGLMNLPLAPYLVEGLVGRLHTEQMNQLMALVDPFSYRQFLTLPKYVITASGDEFFPPDSSRHYWSELTGPKLLRTYPNSKHYIYRKDPKRVTDTLISFAGYILEGWPLPELDDSALTEAGGAVVVSEQPVKAILWQVENAKARDFRMTTLEKAGRAWQPTELPVPCQVNSDQGCLFDIKVEAPETGYKAWFVEFTLARHPSTGTSSYPPLVITTPVKVLSGQGD